ncbi:MAG: hypothetical protein ACK42D_02455 [Candidatus Paceibacteria bacterium]
MTQALKNVLALGLLAGVGLLGYFMFVQRDSNNLILGQDNFVSDQLLVQASTFIEKRMVIEALTIDTAILMDPRFVNLDTFTSPVPDQPIGKISLFEPAEELSNSQ